MARRPIKPKDDLAELDEVVKVHEEGIVVPILSIDGVSDLGFGIRIAGPESHAYQAARDRLTMDIVRLAATSEDGVIGDGERRKLETSFLAKISMSFTAPAKLDGKILENTEEDFTKLYRRFDFIRRQIDRAQADRGNFMPPSSGSSETSSADASAGSESSQEMQQPESGGSSGE